MPQTREHLAIIDLLGIGRGVVALTKTDIASPERVAEVIAQIGRVTAGTKLEGAEIIPVSARTGQGIDRLRVRLEAAADDISDRSSEARFPPRRRSRLHAAGHWRRRHRQPSCPARCMSGIVCWSVRRATPHGFVRCTLRTSRRSADRPEIAAHFNLVGDSVSKESIHRGDVVLDPDLHAPTERIDARLHLLASETRPARQWLPARLHHASVESRSTHRPP